jgi:Transglutaminase-like superfamily
VASPSSSGSASSLGPLGKAALAFRIWSRFLLIRAMLPRQPLPAFVSRLGRPARPTRRRLSHALLARAVHRTLQLGSRRPSCLVASLVLFRLLREQGDHAEVVIGLPGIARSKDAHAWVELGGVDVGPPPGRGSHEAMARFG